MKLTSTCKSQKPELLLPERFTVADEIHQSEITPFSVTSVIPWRSMGTIFVSPRYVSPRRDDCLTKRDRQPFVTDELDSAKVGSAWMHGCDEIATNSPLLWLLDLGCLFWGAGDAQVPLRFPGKTEFPVASGAFAQQFFDWRAEWNSARFPAFWLSRFSFN